MGKMCWINGQPYSVGLPTGGKNEDDYDNQWDEMINFLREESNHMFHWNEVFSWCKEATRSRLCVMRGYDSARYWDYSNAKTFGPTLGFRPVLTPLNTDTLRPDPSLLKEISDGTKIALASLYMGGKPVDLSEEKGPNYNKGGEIILGNRDKNKNSWLYVIKYKDLLWADRNVLVNLSWEELQEQGYTD